MTIEKAQDTAAPTGAASALSAGLGVKPCRHCGSERYIIKMLYKGPRNNVAVVECGDCGGDTTPVMLDYFMPEAECYTKCREAWNAANETPNVQGNRASRHHREAPVHRRVGPLSGDET